MLVLVLGLALVMGLVLALVLFLGLALGLFLSRGAWGLGIAPYLRLIIPQRPATFRKHRGFPRISAVASGKCECPEFGHPGLVYSIYPFLPSCRWEVPKFHLSSGETVDFRGFPKKPTDVFSQPDHWRSCEN